MGSTSNSLSSPPPYVARYAPVFWEPNPGAGERFVSVIAIAPEFGLDGLLGVGAHTVLTAPKLRAMLGPDRALSALGILDQTASLLTDQLVRGAPLEAIRVPFAGFTIGEVRRVRARSLEQMLDAVVRSVSAVASPDAITGAPDEDAVGRATYRTARFLKKLRTEFAGNDRGRRARFEQRMPGPDGLPDITVDYAFERWIVQVTSLPGTKQQVAATDREAKAKMLELDMAQRRMTDDRNTSEALLIVNAAEMLEGETHATVAAAQLPLIHGLGRAYNAQVRLVHSPAEAAGILEALR